MKNITNQKKTHQSPSKKTGWAYWMQAIEPTSKAIDEAFPGYHPQWVQQSQMLTIGALNFINLRRLLGMTREQCAAYMRVKERTVARWENGLYPIPFTAFELMRVILESVKFKLSHPEWDGWFITESGVLVSPDYGRNGYTTDQLNSSALTTASNVLLTNEVARLEAELSEAISENTRIRQLFLSEGVVDELAVMQEKLNKLMEGIKTAHVIPFPAVENQKQEKVA